MRRTLEITTGRHPFQVAIVGACLLSSLAIIATGYQPRSVARALPDAFLKIWLGALAVNSLIALGGMFWSRPLRRGLVAEAGGLIGLAAMTSVYSASIARLSGWDALGTGGLVLGIAVACWWRAGQIVRDVRRLNRAQTDPVLQSRLLLTEPAPAERRGDGERP